MNRWSFILLLLSIVFITSCHQEALEEELIIDIADEFVVGLKESLSASNRQLGLEVKSIVPLNCTNFTLDYNKTLNADKTIVSLNDLILEGESCQEGVAPSYTYIDLGEMNGTHLSKIELNLKNNEIKNNGKFEFFSDHLILDFESDHGIEIPYKTLHFVKEDMVWVALNIEENENQAEEILSAFADRFSQLTEAISIPQDTMYFGHFMTVDEKIKQVSVGARLYRENLFLATRSSEIQNFLSLKEELIAQYDNRVKIYMAFGDGTIL